MKEKVIINNAIGLHARPASIFLKEAVRFQSDVTVHKEGKSYNGKSILGIISMSARRGDIIEIETHGEDEKEALDALVKVIEELDD